MTYEELKHFISEKMSLSHVYQPVMLKTLLCNEGAELLRQKQEKGISWRGYVASYQTPSIGYDPRSNRATSVQPGQSSSNLCKYTVGAKTISVSKRNTWSSCPTSLEIPNDMNTHFDLSQMGSSSGTLRYLEAKTSADYCYYTGGIQIPKAAYGSCRSSIVYWGDGIWNHEKSSHET